MFRTSTSASTFASTDNSTSGSTSTSTSISTSTSTSISTSTSTSTIDRVYAIAESVAQLVGAWPLGAADECVELQRAETPLGVARATMMVIAGVNVVEPLQKHPQRKAMVAQVLSEGAENMTAPLRLKLKHIVEKQS